MCRAGCRIGLVALGCALLASAHAAAQQRLLSIDDLYDPTRRVAFGAPPPRDLQWIDDAHYLWVREVPERSERFEHLKVNAVTGAAAPLFDASALERALWRIPGVAVDDARRLARQRSYVMNPRSDALLVEVGDDLYYWALGADMASPLTSAPGKEEEATFSPDARMVAYVRDHNLFVADLHGRERALTTDGRAQLLNGKLDWVYQEEVYGRGHFRAYWWSPDSSQLAYLQIDDTQVPHFTVIDHIPYRQVVEDGPYPKAGDPNPRVRLGIVRATGGSTEWIDLRRYADDILLVHVDWLPDASRVTYQVQDREQTWLDLNVAEAATGESRTLFRETTPAWVSRLENPLWLRDGSFLWLSERTGWQHVFHYRADGALVRQVTDGPWEVDSVYAADESSGWIYFEGTERSHIGRDVYRVRLDGSGLTRLSARPGTHKAAFNPVNTLYLGIWSDASTPHQVRVHRADGTEVRLVDLNDVPALASYALSPPEFLQVPSRDGFLMEAMIIKPPDFDPTRRYPVYQHTYAGPHAPQVRNAWGGVSALYLQLLAQRGIIVWVCDNRTASGKGAVSAWPAYQRLGEMELQDIEDGVAWLKKQPWVDASRIGLSGWSYGGFMTSYALTHSTSFAMGIAGGSVTDWRAYDSIYTERFMRMPQNNPDGYDRTAPTRAAGNLSGQLLLMHGTMDDNVHLQNTLQFAYALQRAGKAFELMLYPKSRHGVTDPPLVMHMRQTMLDFTLRTLRPGVQPDTPAAPTAGAALVH